MCVEGGKYPTPDTMPHFNTLKHKAHAFNTAVYALYLSYRDSRVKWYVRVLLALAIGYALSPLDLVPDLRVVFGYLDDVLLVTLGLFGSYRLVPKQVVQEAQHQAYEEMGYESGNPVVALKVISYTWLLLLTLTALIGYKILFLDILY